MKKYGKIFFIAVLLLTCFLVNKVSVYAGKVTIWGQDYDTNANVPMPATPSPPPSSTTSTTTVKQTTPTHKKPSSNNDWVDQASTDIADSIVKAHKQAELKKQQEAALAALKKAEEEKKKKEKQKLDAQKWIYDFQDDTNVAKLNKGSSKIMSLKDSDPYEPKKSSISKYSKGLYDTSSMTKENKYKCGEWMQGKAKQAYLKGDMTNGDFYKDQTYLLMKNQAIDVNCNQALQGASYANKISSQAVKKYDPYVPTEDNLRRTYEKTSIELENCANGTQKCSPEYVKNLKAIQIKSEQELIERYPNYKEVIKH